LSIAAVPPLAAFWSKEHIAAAAEEARLAWFVLVIVAAAGSAAYLLRPVLLLWRGGEPAGSPQRGGRAVMLAGVAALAAGSLGLGAVGEPLAGLLGGPGLPSSGPSLALSLGATILGGAAVALGFAAPPALVAAARAQLYTNDLLRRAVQRPLLALAHGADVADRRVLDAAVDGMGRGGLVAARGQDWVERRGVDAAVDGLASAVGRGGEDLRRLQSGRLFEYLRGAVLGGAGVAFVVALSAVT
jgi:NADH:ubiquinone oxidoreductase subunit 5 (subunit L)/multisubunit Na+/H+ antiporter MnhA subunit